MKEKVKENILQTLVDVKKELLQQYHIANVSLYLTQIETLNQGNEGGMINLVPKKTKKS